MSQGAAHQIHSIATHQSQPDKCASGSSNGTVAVWDLRFNAAPLVAITGRQNAGDVWQVSVAPDISLRTVGFAVSLRLSMHANSSVCGPSTIKKKVKCKTPCMETGLLCLCIVAELWTCRLHGTLLSHTVHSRPECVLQFA